MCIIAADKQVIKTGRLQLWKIIRHSNCVGVWEETYNCRHNFSTGVNIANDFRDTHGRKQPGCFCCFFTRAAARTYCLELTHLGRRGKHSRKTKVIKVYANSRDVVVSGVDKRTGLRCLGVSKMEIKSLQHQR